METERIVGERAMDEEELLKKAEKIDGIEDLSDSERKFIEKMIESLREEKRLAKKDKERILEMHREHVASGEEDEDPNGDIDEDDFV